MSPTKHLPIQNLQKFFLIEGTSTIGYFEAFNSSLAQSSGELWLTVLRKNPCAKRLARPGLKCSLRLPMPLVN